MKPLNVAIHHRGDWYRYARVDGMFNYMVPEFTWKQFCFLKTEPIFLELLQGTFDVAWMDEGKYKRYKLFEPEADVGRRPVPVVYYALYPTLREDIFHSRVHLAEAQADLVLLDHDNVKRWRDAVTCPVRRLGYAVNERYYRDRGYARDIDVGFYCVYAFNRERPALDDWLEKFCKRKGYVYGTTKGENVRTKYADLLARTKVVVHLNRTRDTRTPRIFDTAACGTALLSNPIPKVSGEHFEPWVHYAPFNEPQSKDYTPFSSYPAFTDKECAEIIAGLEWLLDQGHWEHIAARAKDYVLSCHTWAQRAKELRGILLDVFPWLREKVGEGWMYQ